MGRNERTESERGSDGRTERLYTIYECLLDRAKQAIVFTIAFFGTLGLASVAIIIAWKTGSVPNNIIVALSTLLGASVGYFLNPPKGQVEIGELVTLVRSLTERKT